MTGQLLRRALLGAETGLRAADPSENAWGIGKALGADRMVGRLRVVRTRASPELVTSVCDVLVAGFFCAPRVRIAEQ